MKIAMTSPNAKNISGHAGKCPGYLIYEIDENKNIQKTHLKLAKEQVFQNFSGPLSRSPNHPLNGINIFVTQSIGEGLNRRLNEDGIKVYTTENKDTEEIIQSLLMN